MQRDYRKTLEALREAISLPWHSLTIGVRTPPPADIHYLAFGQPRAVIPLRGVKHMRYASSDGVISKNFHPGEALLCNADVWCEECWQNPHTMFSIVLRPDYLRLLTIDFRHPELPPGENPDSFFYHTPGAPPPVIYHTFSALLSNHGCLEAAVMNFRALLLHIEYFLTHLPEEPEEKNDYAWACIHDFLDTNFTDHLDRNDIAGQLKMHPATLSRIVRKNAGCGVTEYLTQCRLNYAVMLLRDPELSIKEIADACGFSHVNYFIRVFRRRYLVSPGHFRKHSLQQTI